MIEIAEQRLPIAHAMGRHVRGKLEHFAAGKPARIVADQIVNGQTGRIIGHERIVLLAELAGEREMAPRPHERHIGRHGGMIRPVELGDERRNGRVILGIGVGSRLGE
ncbi:MAG TPA: hypothetical protein VGL71_05795 [Urbifossiella sp.]